MIKTKNGATTIRGKHAEVLADFTAITRSLYEALVGKGIEDAEAKEQIEGSLNLAFAHIDGRLAEYVIDSLARKLKEEIGSDL